jgi:hypothetical protein
MSGVVRELHQAMMDDKFWGDIEYEWEQDRLETETPQQKAERMLKAQLEEMKRAEGIRKAREEKYVNRCTGGLMKLNRPMPCKYVHEPATVDKFGIKWEAGCQHHKKGICPYLHPGQMGYEEALAAKTQRRRW